MKFPLWNVVVSKISQFENDVSGKIQQFRGNHPLADAAIKTALSVLPFPLNLMAENIYNSSPGSPEEKTNEVIKYLKQIQQQGETQFNALLAKMEDTLSQVGDIKTAMAKESTLVTLSEVLVGGQENINETLNQLSDEVRQLKVPVSGEVNSVGKSFRISDRILAEASGQSFSGLADQQGNEINLKYDDRVVETITGADLDKLDDDAKRIVKTYEKSMENAAAIWEEVKPEIVKQIDPMTKAKLKLQLKDVLDGICHDMQDIIKFLLSLNKNLTDHYLSYRFLCDTAKSRLDSI